MSDTKSSKISSILFSDEVLNFGVYTCQGTFFSALIRNMSLLLYISHILIKNTLTVEIFSHSNSYMLLNVFFVCIILIGITISLINIVFFIIVKFKNYPLDNLFPVLGRNKTSSFKKFLIGFVFILSYILCVDSFVSWFFMINLKFEEEETKSLKVYEAAPGISMMQGNLHNATVNNEISNTV